MTDKHTLSHWGNLSQNPDENHLSLGACNSNYIQIITKQARNRDNGVLIPQSWEYKNSTDTLENSLAIPQKVEHTLGIDPREMRTYVHTKTCTQIFIVALFIIAKSRNTQMFDNECMYG